MSRGHLGKTARRIVGVTGVAWLLGCGNDGEIDLRVDVVVSSEVPSIESGLLRLTLWSFDPGIADLGATPVDVAELPFSHLVGHVEEYTMRVRGSVPREHRHYISVEGFEIRDGREIYVLWDGIEGIDRPTRVVMRYLGG